jgi:hypothetical protein
VVRSLLVAALAIAGTGPLHIHGVHFHRHEHVRIVIGRASGVTYTKRVTATATGAFTASFAGDQIAPCGRFTVSATGALGSRAQLTGMKFPNCTAG